MWCVSREFREALQLGWHGWSVIGESVCGKAHWEAACAIWRRGGGSNSSPETASAFARRVICPWLVPAAQPLELFPAEVVKHLPSVMPGYSPATRAWRIQYEDNDEDDSAVLLLVDSQTINTRERGYVHWFDSFSCWSDPGRETFRMRHSIPARPPSAAASVSPLSPPVEMTARWAGGGAAGDPSFIATFLRQRRFSVTVPRRLYYGQREMDVGDYYATEQGVPVDVFYVGSGSTSDCWHLHDGVIIASLRAVFPHHHHQQEADAFEAGGFGFLCARSGRLLHFMPLIEERCASSNLVVSRPGELWVLDKWADRLLYYGFSFSSATPSAEA
jgi:hypothetical protein